jgi:hypothetical protein
MAGDALQPLYRDEVTGQVVDGVQPWTPSAALVFTNGIVIGPGANVIGGNKPVIKASVAGAGPTALTAAQAKSLVIFDKVDGAIFSLPAAPTAGLEFDFFVLSTVTSNSYKVITGAGTELLIGGYLDVDTDTSNALAAFTANGSTHIAVTQAAAGTNATGGIAGSWLKFTCLDATHWLVQGTVMGAGTVATAFATS